MSDVRCQVVATHLDAYVLRLLTVARAMQCLEGLLGGPHALAGLGRAELLRTVAQGLFHTAGSVRLWAAAQLSTALLAGRALRPDVLLSDAQAIVVRGEGRTRHTAEDVDRLAAIAAAPGLDPTLRASAADQVRSSGERKSGTILHF